MKLGISRQANKLKGKEKEAFLKDYYETKKRLKAAQAPKPTKRSRKPRAPRSGKVVSYSIKD